MYKMSKGEKVNLLIYRDLQGYLWDVRFAQFSLRTTVRPAFDSCPTGCVFKS